MSLCAGESIILTANNGVEATCNWFPNNQLIVLPNCSANVSPNQTTTYQSTWLNALGCEESSTFFIEVNELPNFSINTFQSDSDSEIIISADPPQLTYTWTTSENINFIGNPLIYSFAYGTSSNFSFLVTAENADGCSKSFSQNIQVIQNAILYIPNTFTPNNDEVNQLFLPVFASGYDKINYLFSIYNRWGELIFQSNDFKIGWDGSYNGSPAVTGTYIYKVIYNEAFDAKNYEILGHVNLIR